MSIHRRYIFHYRPGAPLLRIFIGNLILDIKRTKTLNGHYRPTFPPPSSLPRPTHPTFQERKREGERERERKKKMMRIRFISFDSMSSTWMRLPSLGQLKLIACDFSGAGWVEGRGGGGEEGREGFVRVSLFLFCHLLFIFRTDIWQRCTRVSKSPADGPLTEHCHASAPITNFKRLLETHLNKLDLAVSECRNRTNQRKNCGKIKKRKERCNRKRDRKRGAECEPRRNSGKDEIWNRSRPAGVVERWEVSRVTWPSVSYRQSTRPSWKLIMCSNCKRSVHLISPA